MGAHIDRHIVDPDRHVGAVIEVVAAQEILVGFALAAVLRHDQAGDRLEYFPGPRDRPCVELVAGQPSSGSPCSAGRQVRWPRWERPTAIAAGCIERIEAEPGLRRRRLRAAAERRWRRFCRPTRRLHRHRWQGRRICRGTARRGEGWSGGGDGGRRLGRCRWFERRHQQRNQSQSTRTLRHATPHRTDRGETPGVNPHRSKSGSQSRSSHVRIVHSIEHRTSIARLV